MTTVLTRTLGTFAALSAAVAPFASCSTPPGSASEPRIAATSQLLLTTSDPAVVGQWEDASGLRDGIEPLPLVPIHMVLLKNGKVLMWSRYDNDTPTPADYTGSATLGDSPPNELGEVFVWDPATRTSVRIPNTHTNLFCAGNSTLPNGRVLVTGGTLSSPLVPNFQASSGADNGTQDLNVFDPATNAWTLTGEMVWKRWYASNVLLPNGETLVSAGTYQLNAQDAIANQPEIISATGTPARALTSFTGTPTSGGASFDWYEYYPWVHVLSDGVVYNTGAFASTEFVSTSGAGAGTTGPARLSGLTRDYGTSLMFAPDKIMVIGGGQGHLPGGGNDSEMYPGLIDVSPQARASAAWQPVAPLNVGRKMLNGTILPDGSVFVTGGTTDANGYSEDSDASRAYEELWSPWEAVGDGGAQALQIAVAPFADGRLDVYMIGIDNRMWHTWQTVAPSSATPAGAWNGHWVQISDNGSFVLGTHISVVRLPSGDAELVYVNKGSDQYNGNIFRAQISATSGAVTSFAQVGTTANIAHKVYATTPATGPMAGKLDIFIIGLGGSNGDPIWHTWQDTNGNWQPGAPSDFRQIGVTAAAAPTLTCSRLYATSNPSCADEMSVYSRPDGASVVTIIDSARNVRRDVVTQGTEGGFQLVGSADNLATRIAVAPFSDGRSEVFMIGLDGRVWHTWETTPGTWNATDFAAAGPVAQGFTASSIAPVRLPDDHVDLYMADAQNQHVWHTNGDHALAQPILAGDGSGPGTLGTTYDPATAGSPLLSAPLVAAAAFPAYDTRVTGGRSAVLYLDGTQHLWFGYQPDQPVFASELWKPGATSWTQMAAQQIPRTYHSSVVLMPDGRVFSGGGGGGGGGVGSFDGHSLEVPRHRNAQLFAPPYLFSGPRPTIAWAPASVHLGASFEVLMADNTPISRVTLLGLGATTHSFNDGQHFNELTVSQSGEILTIQAPANVNVAPPTYYMLFALNAAGVPSVAAFVQILP